MNPGIDVHLFRVSPVVEKEFGFYPPEVQTYLAGKSGKERIRSQAAYSFLIEKCKERGMDPEFDFSGKPALKNGFRFSLSHTDEYVAVAIAECEVGIDIEKKNRPIAPRLYRTLSENEKELCENDPGAFLKIWVKKEAYLKSTGQGLQLRPEEVDTTALKNCLVFERGGLWIALCSEKTVDESDVRLISDL